jgi:cyclopropane fatty-acyl-phospholipid synthase-like methyltransferase
MEMVQVTTRLRAILNSPQMYDIYQAVVGAVRFREEILNQYIRPRNQMKILDLGCGTGRILDYLPHVDYVGIDLSEKYITEAQQRYGGRGTFHAGLAEQAEWLTNGQFDLVLAIGVLHHLGDLEAKAMIALATSALRVVGRMVAVDPCFDKQQSFFARFLASRDRGQNVRTEQGYQDLAQPYFSTVKGTVRHDLLRIPYTHCILECTGRL